MTEEPRLLGGRYQLGPVIGRGGMAEVRRARDLRLSRDVAIKQLRVDLASDPTFQARFRREAQAAAGLNHPNIVSVYDTGEEPDPNSGVMVPFIVMELVEGHTLRELLRTGRQIMPAKALEFSQGVLEALGYSHKAGIVHRDIKPANVMLTTGGVVKVMDFGIARAVADTSATMTQTAAVIGTAQYLSPEQARGETVDYRSDIYSAGCLLYELLVGRPPFIGDSPVSVAYQHVREAPVPPSHLDPEITPGMDAITLKALAKDPADRYQTASAMRADITRLLAGQEVTARAPAAAIPVPVGASALATASRGSEPTTVLAADEHHTASRVYETAKPRRRWGLLAFILALILAAGGIGAFYLFQASQVETVDVPWVVDRREAEAIDALMQAKLQPRVQQVTGPDDTTKGRVTKQSVFDKKVQIGTEVIITVNIGPTKGVIPAVAGLDYRDAVKMLNANGFTNVTPLPATSEPVSAKADEVTSVDPAEGASVTLDTPIKVYYATGMGVVPRLTGLSEEDARRVAKNAGFSKITIEKVESPTQVGLVIEQNPAVGSNVKRTTSILLRVAIAMPTPPPPTTPSPTPSPTAT
ncbi:MAG TPA: Stk1 family PASTA domain-containing Ser/Thr kinase [Propionicimonas sp.]|uniref:Stk1 family PASTA domain-containing Ser/Thr kinase n=1 Tax=Propionicimonas sp. TaxID=1955623 RepID=UPI002F404FF0